MAVEAFDKYSVQKRKIEFVEYVGMGLTPWQALKKIGYEGNSSSLKKSATTMMNDPWVAGELLKLHTENREEMKITREKVQSIVLEAIDMGRTIADPMAIIRGAQELNKMCGFYAPEEKKITLTAEQRRLTAKYDEISDEELMALVQQKDAANAVEAEFEVIPDEEQLAPVQSKFADRENYDPEEG